MVKRLETLTPAQVALLPAIRDKWLAIGLSTVPADRPRAEAAVKLAYRRANLPEPTLLIWLNSPLAGAYGSAFLKALPAAQVRAQVGDQVRDQVGAQVGAQVRDQVGAQVGDQVGDQVGAQVWDQVWAQVGAQVRAQVWDQVGDQVWAQVGDQVWDQVWCAGYGQHDANWLGFYETFGEFGLPDMVERLDGLVGIAQSCGWWWPFMGAVILTDRPVRLSSDERGRLHDETRMALEYPDGWGVYAWHGVRVPAFVIEAPATITVDQIKAEQNAEVRRVMLARMGEDRFVQASGARPIHSDRCGVLYDFGDETLAVKVINSTAEPDGTFKPYWLYVHPELRPLHMKDNGEVEMGEPQTKTARNAVASTFGLRGAEYAPDQET